MSSRIFNHRHSKLLLLGLSLIFSCVSSANLMSEGNWEFTKPLKKVGDTSLDSTVVFPVYHSNELNYYNIKKQVESVASISIQNYQNYDEVLDKSFNNIKNSYYSDLKLFGNYKKIMQYLDTKKYMAKKMNSGLILFSLKLNLPVVSKPFTYFNNLNDFNKLFIDKQYFNWPTNSEGRARIVLSDTQRTTYRMSNEKANKLANIFYQLFGINIVNGVSALLYNQYGDELYAAKKTSNGHVTFYGLHLDTGVAVSPFTIKQFEY